MADYRPDVEQPRPTPRASGKDIQARVIEDIAARRLVGIERYGTPLQAHNGRDALRDAYDEALDLACYLRQLIEERIDLIDAEIVEACDECETGGVNCRAHGGGTWADQQEAAGRGYGEASAGG